ncbi:MAG: Clp1/GlmU family protein [Candidatus Bathyarchaeia archaeon]
MNRTVEKGKTLLVDGPASVAIISGKVEIFGFTPNTASRIVIREGKRLPFLVYETATFDLSLSETAGVEEVEFNTIPMSWANAFDELSRMETKPVVTIVLGSVDSGKSSFCTYLVNRLLGLKKKVAVLDGDIGQSDIGPPCAVSYAFVPKAVTDLFNLQAKNAMFIGTTSPSRNSEKVIDGLAMLKKEILTNNPDFIIMNTDGWIEGEDAVRYKIRLVEKTNPDVVFFIQQKDELTFLANALEKFRKITVESPPVISQRSREKRKNLRELGYVKYLRNAKVQSSPLGWLKIENDETFGLGKTYTNMKEANRLYALLGMKPLHVIDQAGKVSIIVGRKRWVDVEKLKKIEEAFKKKVVLIRKGEEEGLIMGLYDAQRKFLGIGILQEVEYLKKTIKILTPVSKGIAIAALGKVKLDRNMKEIPAFEETFDASSFNKLF